MFCTFNLSNAADYVVDPTCFSNFANYSQQCALGRNETSGTDAATCANWSRVICSRLCGGTCSTDQVTYRGARLVCTYEDTSCTLTFGTGAAAGTAAESPSITSAGAPAPPDTSTNFTPRAISSPAVDNDTNLDLPEELVDVDEDTVDEEVGSGADDATEG